MAPVPDAEKVTRRWVAMRHPLMLMRFRRRWCSPDMAVWLEAAWDIRKSWFVRTGSGAYVDALRRAWRP